MMSRFSFLVRLIGVPVVACATVEPIIPKPHASQDHLQEKTRVPQIPIPEVQWIGDDVATIPAATFILDEFAHWEVITESQRAEARRFYGGHQWDERLAHEREKEHRPWLTANRLPSLVAASLAADRGLLNNEEIDRLCIIITLRNMDAQKFYNYMASTAVEMAGINSINARARITSAV
jgi:hypothetical protein